MTNDSLTAADRLSSRAAAGWISRRMQPDGSLQGAVSINDYYKTVAGLALAGSQRESECMLNFVERRFLRDDGDLDGAGCTWFEQFRIYPHAWLLMAAILRARFDLVHRWSDFLERFQDPDNGGFYGTLEQQQVRGEQEFMSTGVAAIALLWAGRTEAAVRTGHWMRQLLESQPDISRQLFFVWHRQNGLVTSFPEEKATEYRVNCAATAQWYFQYGIGAALSAGLFGCTRDRSWLALGRRFLEAAKYCRDDVFRQAASGKIGWGAAWMYRITRDPADRAIAEAVHENLRESQHSGGGWRADTIYTRDPGPQESGQMELTSEFAALQSWMEDALGLST